ncbi:glycoside hydrolase family 15 protein [Micromonospora eburnea]|uniref:Glucoamylase (Glucan-1,4-alpha-glucosidase), GH15 family n=1 Tax=Micromonospora eburnea TaxID=227316 RepID=A0A1C6UKM6_9ACTN|nr:glycoside hydrolase family 15 protein [Micromonospora eburnea]SCL54504.1 Glucoamylase (glucan-1,4-alpha-glucosidase), GH15 family [Micromonospora eburnea]
MTVPPIDSYAFLSDTHTTALVGPDGAVEWFCVPHAEGDAVCARLLDRRVGGSFALSVAGCPEPVRRYLPDTLVVESRYPAATGTAVGQDFLAIRPGAPDRPIHAEKLLVRRVTAERGTVRLAIRLRPRPGYGAAAAEWAAADGRWQARGVPLDVRATLPLAADGGSLCGEIELPEGATATVLIGYGERSGPAAPQELLDRTCRTWRDWSARSDYAGFGADVVRHSALVLRGLSFDETGALLAAPTTSLPEEIGGVRNWDYRFTWHRDAALLLLALFRLGHAEEGRRYLRFLLDVCSGPGDTLAPLVGIRGVTTDEQALPHLSGYAGSTPVRIGNGAVGQVQFDTYGHVLDAALAYQQLTGELTAEQWRLLRRHVDVMAQRWREPDHGIWEIRGPRRHYVNSKVMTWVCLDRGIRLADLAGDHDAPVRRWRAERDALHAEVCDRGYDRELGSFVMAYGSREVDAGLLRIPVVGFLPGDDPRVAGTVDRIRERLTIGPVLLRRYAVGDGLPGEEGAFLLCCFELVSALVLAGRRDDARGVFDQLCGYAGPLGLYAEQLAADGTALGNYPQAFTHLALIEAALNLDGAADRDALHSWAERHPIRPEPRRGP